MPIELTKELPRLTQEQFHAIDKAVMGMAFEIHNSLGRLFKETAYQAAMQTRALANGMTCQRESEVQLVHKGFRKSYFIDLTIDGIIYETKTASALSAQHDAQLLNYLMLTNSSHAKLINFRPSSVESKFISTQLTTSKRQKFELHASNPDIQKTLTELLEDWGTHLTVSLYREALIQLLGASEVSVPIIDKTIPVGCQQMHTLADNNALVVTGISQKQGLQNYKTHLNRLLGSTALPAIHWINFNQSHIVQVTLEK